MVLLLLCIIYSWQYNVVWRHNHTSASPLSNLVIISSFWNIINVVCFLLPTAPRLLLLGSCKAIITAQWAQKSPDIIKSWNKLSTDGKSSSQIVHIWSWDYFTHVLQYQDFWIFSSHIKGILLYNASISCENIFIFCNKLKFSIKMPHWVFICSTFWEVKSNILVS